MAVISICRGTKSGGDALAACMAGELDLPTLGLEVIEQAAEQLGVSAGDLDEKLEDRPGLFDRSASLRRLYLGAIRAELARAVVEARGNLIYHGLAGGLLLKEIPGIFCVRLIAPLELRVQALREMEDMDVDEAEAFILEVDEARAQWVKTMYGEDIMDPSLYDLIVNLGTFSVPEACQIVTRAVGRPEFAVTERRLARMEDFRIAADAGLALMDDMGTQTLNLDTRAVDGVVTVTGEAPMYSRTGDVGKRITEIVTSVSGVKDVVLDLEWFDPYP